MKIIRRPKQHTLLAFLMALSTPVFILNLWVINKGSLAKMMDLETRRFMIIQAVWMLATVFWLLRARWAGFISFFAMTAVLLATNLVLLISTKNYALAFYALFVLILAALYALNLFKDLRETYYHSGKKWFEGHPRYLPKVEAELWSGDTAVPARLSRLGEEGCYAYPTFEGAVDRVEAIRLKLGELQLDCAVELVSASADGKGKGLKFIAASADQTKDIKDFIDRLRSSGYVA